MQPHTRATSCLAFASLGLLALRVSLFALDSDAAPFGILTLPLGILEDFLGILEDP